jgi:CubicO group peptidase (beta-lactamase class C family)
MALRRKVLVPLIVGATLCLHACLIAPRTLLPFSSLEPQDIDDGWRIVSPEDEGFSSEGLKDVYRGLHDGDLWQLRSLLVFRHGRLVAESYLKDESDRTTPRAIWSATKQFTGILVGIAVDQGLISPQDHLADCIEEIDEEYPNKSAIRIENLLEMQSGNAYSNDGSQGQTSQMLRQLPDDSLDFILSLPQTQPPGEESNYNDGDPHLLSLCLQRLVHQPLDKWAEKVLFEPIDLRRLHWERYRDGSTLGAFGILTTPRELGRVAQLVLDGGTFDGKTIVSREWIDEMTAPRVESFDEDFGFGYLWWYSQKDAASLMSGHGGQYAIIDWATETIVVITSEPNTQDDFQIDHDEALSIFRDVLGALDVP